MLSETVRDLNDNRNFELWDPCWDFPFKTRKFLTIIIIVIYAQEKLAPGPFSNKMR